MTAQISAQVCTCGHPEDVHTVRRPEGACLACTQCDGLLRDRPHNWRRCCCPEFEPAVPLDEVYGDQLDAVLRAHAEVEVSAPSVSPWAGHPIGLHSHAIGEPCDDTCTFYPAPRSQP